MWKTRQVSVLQNLLTVFRNKVAHSSPSSSTTVEEAGKYFVSSAGHYRNFDRLINVFTNTTPMS